MNKFVRLTVSSSISRVHNGSYILNHCTSQKSHGVGDNRCSSTAAPTMWENWGFTGRLKHKKWVLDRSALHLYLCCAELPDYDLMMRELQLSDTFNSYFRVLQLHIWMSMVRLSQEGREGKFVRNCLVKYLWMDLDKKSRKLGQEASSTMRAEGVNVISQQFKASLYAYDEGLMSDDHVLAGALWRNLFEKNCADVHHMEAMIEYIRRQIAYLDLLDSNTLITTGVVKFRPFHDTVDSANRQKLILTEIAKRISLS